MVSLLDLLRCLESLHFLGIAPEYLDSARHGADLVAPVRARHRAVRSPVASRCIACSMARKGLVMLRTRMRLVISASTRMTAPIVTPARPVA